MEIKPVIMVLTDISGYTRFMLMRNISLLHAERIITDLLEAVIDKSKHPLTISKLEGDAIFFYAEMVQDQEAVVKDVLRQVTGFFAAFKSEKHNIISRNMCSCEACTGMGNLKLKAVVHTGDVAIKRIRQFEELAGEDVILIHRLLKNTIPANEYLLETERVNRLCPDYPDWPSETRTENYDDLGEIDVKVFYLSKEAMEIPAPAQSTLWAKLKQMMRYQLYTTVRRLGRKAVGEFSNLPR